MMVAPRLKDLRLLSFEDRDGLRPMPKASLSERRPFKARPQPDETFDPAAVHRELAARYPKIRAKLAE